jgi:hypothetical protein
MMNRPQHRDRAERMLSHHLTRMSAKHRRELIDLLGIPPDPSRVPQEFWTRVEVDFRNQMATVLYVLFFMTLDDFGLGSNQDFFADDAQYWAKDRADSLAKMYGDNSRAMLNRKFQMAGHPDRHLPEYRTNLDRELRPIFGHRRAASISRTEVTKAITRTTIEVGKKMGRFDKRFDEGTDFLWRLGDCDHCEFCPMVAGFGRAVWGVLTDGPPCHPNCCCWLDPVPASRVPTYTPPMAMLAAAAQRSGIWPATGLAFR